MVEEASRADAPLECVFWDDRIERTGRGRRLFQKLSGEKIRMENLASGKLDRLSDTVTPAGIVAIAKKPVWKPPSSWPRGDLMILETIRDPGNLGTVIRTAEAGGVGGILLTGDCVELYNPKVVRATMGSIFRVPTSEIPDQSDVAGLCLEKGLTLTGLSAETGDNLFEMSHQGPSAYVFGGEHRGISESMASYCKRWVRIPMAGRVDSLNLAVSFALVVFYGNRLPPVSQVRIQPKKSK